MKSLFIDDDDWSEKEEESSDGYGRLGCSKDLFSLYLGGLNVRSLLGRNIFPLVDIGSFILLLSLLRLYLESLSYLLDWLGSRESLLYELPVRLESEYERDICDPSGLLLFRSKLRGFFSSLDITGSPRACRADGIWLVVVLSSAYGDLTSINLSFGPNSSELNCRLEFLASA